MPHHKHGRNMDECCERIRWHACAQWRSAVHAVHSSAVEVLFFQVGVSRKGRQAEGHSNIRNGRAGKWFPHFSCVEREGNAAQVGTLDLKENRTLKLF